MCINLKQVITLPNWWLWGIRYFKMNQLALVTRHFLLWLVRVRMRCQCVGGMLLNHSSEPRQQMFLFQHWTSNTQYKHKAVGENPVTCWWGSKAVNLSAVGWSFSPDAVKISYKGLFGTLTSLFLLHNPIWQSIGIWNKTCALQIHCCIQVPIRYFRSPDNFY